MDDGPIWLLLFVLFILIIFSAFFSASETAFTSMNETRLKTMAKKRKSAKLALKLSENFDRVLSTLLIGNNIVNIAAASLSTVIFVSYFGDIGVTISTIVLTITILVLSEITPKSIAKEIPEKVAVLVAYPVFFFYCLFLPINYIFDGWKWCLAKIFRFKKNPTLTEEEFQIIVSDIKEEGIINQNEHDLIQKSIIFDDALVENVMHGAEDMVYIVKGQSLEEIKKMFEENNYSRVPIFDENKEKIIGMILQKDFYEMLLEEDCTLESIIKKPLFTKTTTKIADLFKRFQKMHQHIAIVRTDNLEIVGIITMEDIIEELVGEIEDEYDEE